jgi:hypothetical protein
MGGRAAGEIAGRIALCTVLEHFDRPRKSGNFPGSGEALEGISEAANAGRAQFKLRIARSTRLIERAWFKELFSSSGPDRMTAQKD